MKKLRLDLNRLEVETFDTVRTRQAARGTVDGAESYDGAAAEVAPYSNYRLNCTGDDGPNTEPPSGNTCPTQDFRCNTPMCPTNTCYSPCQG